MGFNLNVNYASVGCGGFTDPNNIHMCNKRNNRIEMNALSTG